MKTRQSIAHANQFLEVAKPQNEKTGQRKKQTKTVPKSGHNVWADTQAFTISLSVLNDCPTGYEDHFFKTLKKKIFFKPTKPKRLKKKTHPVHE